MFLAAGHRARENSRLEKWPRALPLHPPQLLQATPTLAAAEIRSLKPGARVFEKKSSLFFLSTPGQALANIEARKQAEDEFNKGKRKEEKSKAL